MPKILIVGGGYAGFYTAFKLQKHLRRGEAEVTLVDPLPYMTYQPFLPEVAAGSIEPRHVIVPLRRHLKKTNVVQGKVVAVDHKKKTATIEPSAGKSYTVKYDQIVLAAGSVSRTFPIPGVADEAIGMKSIEEAVAVRDRLIDNFAKAANLPAGKERDRLLTVTVVGGGFAGIETFAELRSLASGLLKQYPELTIEDIVVGDGAEAAPGGQVEVHYVGVDYETGEEFDSSWGRGEPATFNVNQVIQGFHDAIVGQAIGSRVVVIVPAELGYGDAGSGENIAGGDTIMFVIDILGLG